MVSETLKIPEEGMSFFGKTKSESIDQVYENTLQNLKSLIEVNFGSSNKFCSANDINPQNLSKVFSGYDGRDMSVGLYVRCLVGLGYIPESRVSEEDLNLKIGLRDYLKVDNNLIMQSIILMQH